MLKIAGAIKKGFPRLVSNPAARFANATLRGVGQVMLQNDPLTGFLFLLGIFVNSGVFGLYALLGTIAATAATGTGLFFGAPHDDVHRGLYGFNGTLTGLGLAVYLRHDTRLLVYVIVASIFVTIVMAAVQDIFGAQGHTLTAPFVIATWIFIGALFTHAGLPVAPADLVPHLRSNALPFAAALSVADAATGILNNLAQVMLQRNPWTGAIFLAALAVNSRLSSVAAAMGSSIGVVVALSLGAAPEPYGAGFTASMQH